MAFDDRRIYEECVKALNPIYQELREKLDIYMYPSVRVTLSNGGSNIVIMVEDKTFYLKPYSTTDFSDNPYPDWVRLMFFCTDVKATDDILERVNQFNSEYEPTLKAYWVKYNGLFAILFSIARPICMVSASSIKSNIEEIEHVLNECVGDGKLFPIKH